MFEKNNHVFIYTTKAKEAINMLKYNQFWK